MFPERPRAGDTATASAEEARWQRLLADAEGSDDLERRWTSHLRNLYPDLPVADLSARFLRPWRRLLESRASLEQIPNQLKLSPLDLPGWQLLGASLLELPPEVDAEERGTLVVRLAEGLVSSAGFQASRRVRSGSVARNPPVLPRSDGTSPPSPVSIGGLVGSSHSMRQLIRACSEAARDRHPTLVLGETGSGKEVVARLIHRLSSHPGPFVAINCPSLSEQLFESELFGHVRGAFTGATAARKGLFAEADGGTLLLDEISEIPVYQQAKVLRVLQDSLVRRVGGSHLEQVDVRVIATSNRDLEEMLAQGLLRRDLYYRLAFHQVRVPPLRSHLEDIPELVTALLERWHLENADLDLPTVEEQAFAHLKACRWPGNVRELERVLFQLASRSRDGRITGDDVARALRERVPANSGRSADTLPKTRLDSLERDAVLRALAASAGNKTRAARLLGVSRKTLYNKLHRYGIDLG